MNDFGYVILDPENNPLLFNPTTFYLIEDELDVIIPFMYDSQRYTIFKTEEAVQELREVWGETILEMGYSVVSLLDYIGEMLIGTN